MLMWGIAFEIAFAAAVSYAPPPKDRVRYRRAARLGRGLPAADARRGVGCRRGLPVGGAPPDGLALTRPNGTIDVGDSDRYCRPVEQGEHAHVR